MTIPSLWVVIASYAANGLRSIFSRPDIPIDQGSALSNREVILRVQQGKSLFFTFALVPFCICCLFYCQNTCHAGATREQQILSPKEGGSAWNLPAGVYSVDENQEGSNSGPGGSPQPESGGSPDPGPGGSYPQFDPSPPGPGGSYGRPNNSPAVGPGGSPSID